jgi:hypothetical protein
MNRLPKTSALLPTNSAIAIAAVCRDFTFPLPSAPNAFVAYVLHS